MLKTMLWQGVLAALVIGGAAAAYARVRDTGYLSAPRDTAAPRDAASPDRGDREARKARGHDRSHDGRDHDRDDDHRRVPRGDTRHD